MHDYCFVNAFATVLTLGVVSAIFLFKRRHGVLKACARADMRHAGHAPSSAGPLFRDHEPGPRA